MPRLQDVVKCHPGGGITANSCFRADERWAKQSGLIFCNTCEGISFCSIDPLAFVYLTHKKVLYLPLLKRTQSHPNKRHEFCLAGPSSWTMKSLNSPLANSVPLVSTASKMTAKHLVYLQQCADSSNFLKTAFSLGQFWSRDTSRADCDVIPMKKNVRRPTVYLKDAIMFELPGTYGFPIQQRPERLRVKAVCRFQTGGMNYSDREYNPAPPPRVMRRGGRHINHVSAAPMRKPAQARIGRCQR